MQRFLAQWLLADHAQSPLLLVGANIEPQLETLSCLAVCENPSDVEPCRHCRACKHATARQHPDVIRTLDDAPQISIQEINHLRSMLARTALGPRRLVIIPRAERLSSITANALLKSLEEPAASTRYVLATPFPSRLPATLRSRCQIVRVEDTSDKSEDTYEPAHDLLDLGGNPFANRDKLDPATLKAVETYARTSLHKEGNSPELFRVFLRLRDYYKIRSLRGNEKLAADALIAALTLLHNTFREKIQERRNDS